MTDEHTIDITTFGGDQAELPDMPPKKVYIAISASGSDTWLDGPWDDLEPGTKIEGNIRGYISAIGLKKTDDGPRPYATIKLEDINITTPNATTDDDDPT